MPRTDKIHLLTAKGRLVCSDAVNPSDYRKTDNPNHVTCFRCLVKAQKKAS